MSNLPEKTLFYSNCTAISPDSQQIATFIQVKVVNDKHLCWSIAISNCVDDGGSERLIALSCFDAKKLRKFRHDKMHSNYENDLDFVNNQYGDDENNLESVGDNVNDLYSDDESEIYTSLQLAEASNTPSDKKNCRNTLCHRGEHLCNAKKHYREVQCTIAKTYA
ncbi:hypothetical protein Glove_219g21 [Diversispora epigaea]|uniref:Uncharacterized protein n=1 Tax=Diversispora epigaea TaxID=1348612 RepID=A0A397INN7_9GLOM|nr:hypothetical protein Glove_219g21 [Diversispora epigaea]